MMSARPLNVPAPRRIPPISRSSTGSPVNSAPGRRRGAMVRQVAQAPHQHQRRGQHSARLQQASDGRLDGLVTPAVRPGRGHARLGP